MSAANLCENIGRHGLGATVKINFPPLVSPTTYSRRSRWTIITFVTAKMLVYHDPAVEDSWLVNQEKFLLNYLSSLVSFEGFPEHPLFFNVLNYT